MPTNRQISDNQLDDGLGFVDLVALFIRRWRIALVAFVVAGLLLSVAMMFVPQRYEAIGLLQTGFMVNDLPTVRADEYAARLQGRFGVRDRGRSLPRVESATQVGTGPKVALVEIRFAADDPQSGHLYAKQAMAEAVFDLQQIHQQELSRLADHVAALQAQIRVSEEQLAKLEARASTRDLDARHDADIMIISQMTSLRNARNEAMLQLSKVRQDQEFVKARAPEISYVPSAAAFQQKPGRLILGVIVFWGATVFSVVAVVFVEFVQRVKFVLSQQRQRLS